MNEIYTFERLYPPKTMFFSFLVHATVSHNLFSTEKHFQKALYGYVSLIIFWLMSSSVILNYELHRKDTTVGVVLLAPK